MDVKMHTPGGRSAPADAALTPDRAPMPSPPAGKLPAEVLGQVMLRLDLSSWVRAALVSRNWREVARSPAIARALADAAGLAPVLPALLQRPFEPGARWAEALVAEAHVDAQLRRGPVTLPGPPPVFDGVRRARPPSLHGPTSSFTPWEAQLSRLPLSLADERHVVVESAAGGVEIRDFAWPTSPGLRLLDRPAVAQCASASQRWLALLARDGALYAFDLTATPTRPIALAADAHESSDVFFHPERDELFYLDAQRTLRSIVFGPETVLRKALGTLQGDISLRQFSAGGNLLAVEASNNGSINLFDLRKTPGTPSASSRAQLTLSDQLVFCGEELRLLEIDRRTLQERDASHGSPTLRARPFFEHPADWPDGPTQNRATRDGAWMAVWKGMSAWTPFAGAEFCLFQVSEAQASVRFFGEASHAYEDVAFDRQNHRAAAMYLDHARNEYGLYFVDLRTAERGESLWTGLPAGRASGEWSLQFTPDGAHLFVRNHASVLRGWAMQGFWLRIAEGNAAALTPIAPAPRFGDDAIAPLRYGDRRSFFVDPRNGVWAAAATHPATMR